MLPKPSSCAGCVYEHKGVGFCPDDVKASDVAILTLLPSMDDVKGRQIVGYLGKGQPLYENTTPKPMIGSAGWLLTNTYLPLAGLNRETTSFYNLIKCHYPGLYKRNKNGQKTIANKKEYEQALQHCTTQHLVFESGTKVIVAQGQEVWDATQGKGQSIQDWRGFVGGIKTQSNIKIYGTLAMGDLFGDPFARFNSRFDFKRLKRLVDRTWPQQIPAQYIAKPETRAQFEAVLKEALEQPEIVCDTEYNPENKLMTHIGIAWKSGDTVKGCQLEWVRGQSTKVERAIFMKYWRQICQKVSVAFWNAKADLPIIEHNLGTIPVKFEDPMQAHAVLWPDMDHDYEFVCSIYGRYPKLKHLSKENMLLYHWGDLIDLVWIWEDLKKELDHDKGCKRKYEEQNKKLIPIILNTEAAGIRINQERVASAIPEYEQKSREATILAGAYCGFPINVGSVSALTAYLLNGESCKLRGMDKDLLAQYRAKYLPFDAEEEKEGGFSIDYICRRVALGAHPLLELRTMYAKNEKIVSSYLRSLSDVRRVYPQINFHTQAGGRHSITKPALATLPPDLRDIIMPDTGQVWIGWDWDAQEPRIQWGESGSRVLEKAFTNGEDIHTTFVCDLYGWEKPRDAKDPHSSSVDAGWRHAHNWGGKDDPRRVFSKTTRYELNYDHSEKAYNAQQKAIRMGISQSIAKVAAQKLLNSDPELRTWFKKIEEEGYKTRIARSWGGGRRVIYWADSMVKFPYNDVRNFPLQGGGADLYNITLVEMSEEVPEAHFVWGAHDSQWYSVDATSWESVYPRIRTVAERPRLIGGRMIPFPGSFKMVNDKGEVTKL